MNRTPVDWLDLNRLNYVYLAEIGEPKNNVLELVIEQALASDFREELEGLGTSPDEPVGAGELLMTYRIEFPITSPTRYVTSRSLEMIPWKPTRGPWPDSTANQSFLSMLMPRARGCERKTHLNITVFCASSTSSKWYQRTRLT